MGMPIQISPSPEQLLAHAKAELDRNERQIKVTEEGELLLREALAELIGGGADPTDSTDPIPAIRTALMKLVMYQLGPVQLALTELHTQRDKIIEFVKRAESPIAGATIIPPSQFGRRER